MRVVVNTSPLIALERIGRLGILKHLFGTIIRPQSVLNELHAGRDRYPLSGELEAAAWITTEPDPPEIILRKDLGTGETAVIALALKTSADLVILDDLQARLVASSLGLNLTGTLGVMLAAHEAGYLADIKDALQHLVQAGFRVPAFVLTQHGLT